MSTKRDQVTNVQRQEIDLAGTPYADKVACILQCDGLDYLKRLRDRSASLFVTAFDTDIVWDVQYHRDLAAQMVRVCANGGCIFGATSASLTAIYDIIGPEVGITPLINSINSDRSNIYLPQFFFRAQNT